MFFDVARFGMHRRLVGARSPLIILRSDVYGWS
jgi:hypothetical protein